MKKKPIITFKEDVHTYFHGDTKFSGVNGLLHRFGFEFDREYFSLRKALSENIEDFWKIYFANGFNFKSPPNETQLKRVFLPRLEKKGLDLNVEIDKILAKWDESCDLGTKFHNEQEEWAHFQGFIENPYDRKKYEVQKKDTPPYGFQNVSFYEDLMELPDGAHTEVIVHSVEHQVAGQVDELFIESKRKYRYVDIGDHKGLSLDTPILTTEGWKVMGDISIGDKVYDKDGIPTNVEIVSEIHFNPCYEITFDTNDTIIADHEHRWVISSRKKKGRKGEGYYEEVEMTTDNIVEYYAERESIGRYDNGNYKYKKLAIKCNEPIECKEVDLPVDPYVLGLWLADGNRTCGVVTSSNNDIWGEVRSRGYVVGENLNHKYPNKTVSRTIYGLSKELKSLDLISNKHLPDIYLNSSYNQRLNLLRGLMDGDGSLNRLRKRCVMQTTQKWQAETLSSLLSSLGIKPTTVEYNVKGFGESKLGYSVSFTSNVNPFLVRNKDYLQVYEKVSNYNPSRFRYINSIRKVKTVPTICIAVDSKSRTYLAGSNLITTHNTNSTLPKLQKDAETLLHPLQHLPDCTYTKYQLQVSIYAYLLELAGFKVRNVGFYHYQDYKPETKKLITMKYLQKECREVLDMHLSLGIK